MPVIITLKDIEETIENLNYRSETTLKSRLIRAVRNFYEDESSIATLNSIDTEQLVKLVWDTGEDAGLIKAKRKNFSSLKSSVNSDLKKLHAEGKNPQGIIIGHNNIFDISDEAKNKALSDIADVFREKGVDTQSKINEILNALSDISIEAISSANGAEAREEIDRFKNIIGNISGKLGLKAPEESVPDKTVFQEGADVKADDGGKVLADITAILQDGEIDVRNKINKIMEAVQGILTDAISCAGPELNNGEAEQIRNLFGDLAGTLQSAQALEGGAGKAAQPADNLSEQSPDGPGCISGIASSVKEMITDVLAAGATGLTSEDTERIKNLFGSLAAEVKEALADGRGLSNIGVVTEGPDETTEEIAADGIEEIEEVVEELDLAEPPYEESPVIDAVELSPDAVAEEILPDEYVEATQEGVIEEAVEVIEELASAQPEALDAAQVEESAPETEFDEIPPDQYADAEPVVEELPGGEIAEIVEEVACTEATETGEIDIAAQEFADYEEVIEQDIQGELAPELLPEEAVATEGELVEELIPDEDIVDAAETLPEDYELTETVPEGEQGELAEVEVIEEAAGDEGEEIIEELVAGGEEASVEQDKIGGGTADSDFQTATEILAQMAEAARALGKIGPDLSNSIYSETEIREKAKFLSEEFDRYLSVRERFYNQHILIKGGNYRVGGARNEFPEQIANLREFYIGKFPVTNALFEIFVEKTGYVTTAEKYGFGMVYIPRMQKTKNTLTGAESFIWNSQLQQKKVPGACWYRPNGPGSTLYVKRTHPVVQVSLEDACAFAAWTGKRIPTEQEWEAAARTFRGYLYPWGDIWQDDACNLEKSLTGDTSPVDKYVKYANECEVADILGNVLEWTLDTWQEPVQPEESEETYVVKGASWISDSPASLTDRQPQYKDVSSNILGFRCIAI